MADPTASMWEVTQLILGAPGADASGIANAHGFSPAEVADLLPLFFDNLQADYSESPGLASLAPPEQAPGEGADEFASRYLSELAARLPGQAEVVSYGSFDAPELDPVGWDPSFDDVPHVGEPISGDPAADLVPDVPDADPFFGSGGRPGDVHELTAADDFGSKHGGPPDVDDAPYVHDDQGLDDMAGPATDTDDPAGIDSHIDSHADTDSHPHTDTGAGHPDPDLSDGAFEF